MGERRDGDPRGGDAGEAGVDDDLGAAGRARPGSARPPSPGRRRRSRWRCGRPGWRRGSPVRSAISPSHRWPRPASSASVRDPTIPTTSEPASGWISARRTISMRLAARADDERALDVATGAALHRQPGAVHRAPGDEQRPRRGAGGGDQGDRGVEAEHPVGEEDAGAGEGGGLGQAGELGRADGDAGGDARGAASGWPAGRGRRRSAARSGWRRRRWRRTWRPWPRRRRPGRRRWRHRRRAIWASRRPWNVRSASTVGFRARRQVRSPQPRSSRPLVARFRSRSYWSRPGTRATCQ